MAKKSDKKVKETTEPVADTELQDTENQQEEADNIELSEAELLSNRVAELEQSLADKQNDFLRLMAEFDNFRKRTQKEKAALVEYAGSEVISALLPVLDDFERSITAMEKTDNVSSLKEGVSMIHDKFIKVLTQKGLEPIEAKGLDFDSGVHEAIGSFEMGEEKVGKVIEEAEKGYKLKDRVIRYSKVIVGE